MAEIEQLDGVLLEHRRIDTGRVRLHVVSAGAADGPVLVLLHGFPDFWYGWARQIPYFARAGFRVIVPDQRGYNLSDKPAGTAAYRLDELGGDVVGLIDALGAPKVYVAGHDWGAGVTWWLAMHAADRLERAVILNVPHLKVMQEHLRSSLRQLFRSWYMFFFQIPLLPEWSARRRNWRMVEQALVGSSRPGTFSPEVLALYRQAWAQPGAYRAMLNWYRAALQIPPHLPADASIDLPLLVLWGAKDRFLGRELAQPSVDLCRQGQLVFLEEASHWVQVEEPARVNELMRRFFLL